MPGLVVSLALLGALLAVAIIQPSRVPASAMAAVAAGLLLATGVVDWADARDELGLLTPVLLFLAAVLVLGAACAFEGVFVAVGGWLAEVHSGGPRLLLAVFVVAAVVTSVLSLDATVVLLTPVVLAAAGRLGVSPRPYVYATGHVANSGSLLLPTGNLTNLLALGATGLTLVHFAGLMLLPWLGVLAVEFAVLGGYFHAELAGPGAPTPAPADTSTFEAAPPCPPAAAGGTPAAADQPLPIFALVVLMATLCGFVVTSIVGVEAYWAAIVGAGVLAGHTLLTGRAAPAKVVAAVDAPFLVFVMGLAVVVRAAVENGLGEATQRLVPASESFPALLLLAVIGAMLANMVNNLPALLILLPAASAVGSIAVLALLIGVNLGPNLTYPGSLATLLWRRALHQHGLVLSLRRFTLLGLLTVPSCLLVGVSALWAGGRFVGR